MASSEESYKKILVQRYKDGVANDDELSVFFFLLAEGQLDRDLEESFSGEEGRWADKGAGKGFLRSLNIYRLGIAASVIFVLIISGLWYYQLPPESSQDKAYHIAPGGDYATLSLSNGKTVRLSDLHSGELIKQGNLRIRKTKAGEVVLSVRAGKASEPLTYQCITTPPGGKWKIVLPDGSRVTLNAASSLSYPSSFEEGGRRVKMTGEVFFQIAKLNDKHGRRLPFIVEVGNEMIEVHGTTFNVNAYSDEENITTTLLEGSVSLSVKGSSERLKLSPGQRASLQGNHFIKEEVNASAVSSWVDNEFVFDNQDIETSLRQIGRWYNVNIIYDVAPECYKIGGSLSRTNKLDDVLRALSLTGCVAFKVEGRTIHVVAANKEH